MSVTIHATTAEDHADVLQLLNDRWTSPDMIIENETIDASRLPGYTARADGELVGLVTLIKRPEEWKF